MRGIIQRRDTSSGWCTASHVRLAGIGLAVTSGLALGGQFPVAKTALPSVDAFHLTAIRYTVAALIFVAILLIVEGPRALRLDGRGVEIATLGAIGFAGFNLLAFIGLAHTRPQNAALIIATMPLTTALVLWVRRGIRPSGATMAFIGLALLGVGIVISKGSLSILTGGQVGLGDLLVLLGSLCWVIYTMGASSFAGWSPVRFTALTTMAGAITLVVVAVVATALGYAHNPSPSAVGGVAWQFVYMIIPGTVVAVLSWNAALKRLGAQNAILFSNLIPITTFAIQIARGYQFSGIELAGAVLTIAALVANNLVQRRSSAHARASVGTAQVIGMGSERRRGDSAILRLSQLDSSS